MKVQVDTSHYDFLKYVNLGRWNSYYYQIKEAAESEGRNVLYVGVGDMVVADTLTKIGKNVGTLDLDKELKPDYVGSVTEISDVLGADKNKFDVIVCSQVLEHIPFSCFEDTIAQMAECTQEKMVLSLPNHNRHVRVLLSGPKPIKTRQKVFSVRSHMSEDWDIERNGNGEHYWEIDAKGCPKLKDVTKILAKYFNVEKIYSPFENPYHVFFILTKK